MLCCFGMFVIMRFMYKAFFMYQEQECLVNRLARGGTSGERALAITLCIFPEK